MEEIKIKAWGLVRLTRRQFIIIESIVFIIFVALTFLLFSYEFPTYTENVVLNFHARYAKYISLLCCFLIIIEAQAFLSKFIKAQLYLIQKQKREIEKQKEEIERQSSALREQRDLARRQHDKIKQQNEAITSSIHYARRIQSALLPPARLMEELLPQHFIYYQPRDIVSGDYYWITKEGDQLFVVAADCTGHGVPGALMSMLGISLLNEAVKNNIRNHGLNIKASEILNELRNSLMNALHQNARNSETKDGMDIALCIIDESKRTIQFSGANNPIYIMRSIDDNSNNQDVNNDKVKSFDISSGQMIQVNPDRMPIGVYVGNQTPFTNHEINFEPGDCIYLFTDGYVDQFGGDKKRKFMLKHFRELLIKIHSLPMETQKEILHKRFSEWKGDLDQVDDILVIGIRF